MKSGIEDPATQNFFLPSVVGLAVEFPLYELDHLYKTRRDRAGRGICGRQEKKEQKEIKI